MPNCPRAGADGRTPVEGARLYVYHTDAKGYYARSVNDAPHHPRIRGWMKTGADGRYEFCRSNPRPIPAATFPLTSMAPLRARAIPRAGSRNTGLRATQEEGRFRDVSGSIKFDPKNPAVSKVGITVQVVSIDTNNGTRDSVLRSDDFF